jgi:hypothetical protein
MIPEQKINDALKKIGKKAKLKSEVIIQRTTGGVLKKTKFKKQKPGCEHRFIATVPNNKILHYFFRKTLQKQ